MVNGIPWDMLVVKGWSNARIGNGYMGSSDLMELNGDISWRYGDISIGLE